jgi:hypothetical protein
MSPNSRAEILVLSMLVIYVVVTAASILIRVYPPNPTFLRRLAVRVTAKISSLITGYPCERLDDHDHGQGRGFAVKMQPQRSREAGEPATALDRPASRPLVPSMQFASARRRIRHRASSVIPPRSIYGGRTNYP